MVRNHTFHKHKFSIYIGPLKGLTLMGQTREILIRTDNLSERMILNTTIHEALHACDWDKTEKKVNNTATDIANFLWRLGYRKIK